MMHLFHAEVRKLLSVRANWTLALCTLIYAMLTVFMLAALPGADAGTADLQREILGVSDVWIFPAVLGVLMATTEIRHGTLGPVALVMPDRWRLVPAKAVVAAAAGAGLVLSATAVATLTLVIMQGWPLILTPSQVGHLVGMHVLFAALVSAFGVGLGAVVRSQVLAIVVLLLVAFLLSQLLLVFTPEVGWWWLANLEQVMLPGSPMLQPEGATTSAPFGPLAATAAMGVYAAVAVVAGAILWRHQEVR